MAGGIFVFIKKYNVTIIPNTKLCLDYFECISLKLKLSGVIKNVTL